MSEELEITVEEHPLLELRSFVTEFPRPLDELQSSAELLRLLAIDAAAPLASNDAIRKAVRDLLRHGGFKPTGRSKPASEYLLKAAGNGPIGSINVAVDACNAVSLHSGLPISVVDFDRVRPPICVAIAPAGAAYIFNQSEQTIDIGGLLCLIDADGPCANAVKDSQRTKTTPSTRRTLSLIWGTRDLPGQADAALACYQDLLEAHGASATLINA